MSARRNPGLGVMLLSAQVLNVGMERIPPVTLSVIIGMVLLYLRVIPAPWSVLDVCLSARGLMNGWDVKRLFISTFEHADDMHLYYNMVSFLWKGMALESRFSSRRFAILLLSFVTLANLTYVALAIMAARVFQDYSYVDQCAIGFSGVIFALKVLTSYYVPQGVTTVAGIVIPVRWTVWFELALIQVLVPNVSSIGHLAGIIVGLAYVHGPLKYLIDTVSYTTDVNYDTNMYSNQPEQHVVCYYESGPVHVPVRGRAENPSPSPQRQPNNESAEALDEEDEDIQFSLPNVIYPLFNPHEDIQNSMQMIHND